MAYAAVAVPAVEQPEVSTPTTPLVRPHMPELDTLRGIAVLLVLFFHGFYFRYGTHGLSGLSRLFVAATRPGWVGVNLFFVLSGFLITGILLDTASNPHYFRNFYARRALRILPLYYGVLAILALLSEHALGLRKASCPFLALSFFYMSNMTELFGVPMQFGVLWSLAVEEHFYLLWPAVVRRLSRRQVILAGLTIFIGCAFLRALYFSRHYYVHNGYTWLFADGLATGAVLAALARGSWGTRARMQRVAVALFASSLALIVVGLPFGITDASGVFGSSVRETALNLFFGSVLITTILLGSSSWRTLVNRRLLQLFGEISYGLYLVHMIVFGLLDSFIDRYLPAWSNRVGHFGLMLAFFVIALILTTLLTYL